MKKPLFAARENVLRLEPKNLHILINSNTACVQEIVDSIERPKQALGLTRKKHGGTDT